MLLAVITFVPYIIALNVRRAVLWEVNFAGPFIMIARFLCSQLAHAGIVLAVYTMICAWSYLSEHRSVILPYVRGLT